MLAFEIAVVLQLSTLLVLYNDGEGSEGFVQTATLSEIIIKHSVKNVRSL